MTHDEVAERLRKVWLRNGGPRAAIHDGHSETSCWGALVGEVVALVAEREQAAREKALDEAAKIVCGGCAGGEERGYGPPTLGDDGYYYHADNDHGGLLDFCEAAGIRALASTPTPGGSDDR